MSGPGPRYWVFFGVFAAWNAALWGVIGAIVTPALPGGWWAIVTVALFALFPLAYFFHYWSSDRSPPRWTRVWMLRPFWYVQLALPFAAATGVVGVVAGLAFGRAVVAGQVAVAVTVSVYALIMVAGYFGTKRLVVKHLTYTSPHVPAAFDGVRIVQATDVHVGPQTSPERLALIARTMQEAEPDVIVFTGDQVDDHGPDVVDFTCAFQALRAPLGVYAIPGNHDVYAGWDEVKSGLDAAGMRVLVNEAVPLARGDGVVWLAGTGDPAGKRWNGAPSAVAPDIDRTLADVPSGGFTVALAHNPALWKGLAARGVDVTLSGHTHHGQLSIPGLKWCLASPFLEHAMGEYREGRSWLYIAPGTHYWGIPMRLGAWPEVTVVTLRRASAAAEAQAP